MVAIVPEKPEKAIYLSRYTNCVPIDKMYFYGIVITETHKTEVIVQASKNQVTKDVTSTAIMGKAVITAGSLMFTVGFIGLILGIMLLNRPANEGTTWLFLEPFASSGAVTILFILSAQCLLFALLSIPVHRLLQKKYEELDFERMYRELPHVLKDAMHLYKEELASNVNDHIAFHRLMIRLQAEYPLVKQELLVLAADLSRLATDDFISLTTKMSELNKIVEAANCETKQGEEVLRKARETIAEIGPQVRSLRSQSGEHRIMAERLIEDLEAMIATVRETLPAPTSTNVIPLHAGE